MTARDDFDRHLAAWLKADAPASEPEQLLGQVLARTARTRRRPAWRIPERWIPMSTITSRTATMTNLPWRSIALATLLILALVVGAILAAGSQRPELPAPFGVAGNGAILSVDGGDVLVRESLDGVARPLIDLDRDVVAPWPAPDGSKFSYFTFNPDGTLDVWVADIDGTGARRIAGPYDAPVAIDWSPQGDALAIQDVPTTGDPYIEVASADGTERTRLDVGMPASSPDWRAPDGRQLLFRSENGPDTGLFLVGRDGAGLTRLALDGSLGPGLFTSDDFQVPSLSPDGNHLTYFSAAGRNTAEQGIGPQVHVATLGPAGEILDDRVIAHEPGDADYGPQFLPTGDEIVFWRMDDHDASSSLHVSPIDGSTPARDLGCCTSGTGEDLGWIVAPDGASVLLWTRDGTPVRSLDLATGEVSETDLTTTDIVAWQRTAP
jgi:hypothetical protein